jgi:hypothetical protein
MKESDFLREARLYLGQLDDFVTWRNDTAELARVSMGELKQIVDAIDAGNVRSARAIAARALGRGKIMAGLCKGSSDLIAIYRPRGRFVAIELKVEGWRVDPEQKLFLDLITRMGGYAGVAYSMDELIEHVRKIRGDK